MIGPSSISDATKWTVAPCCFTPASSARRCVSSPLNCGSSAGWILIMRPLQRLTNHGVNSRMKPARQTISIRFASKFGIERAFERFAVLAEGRVIDQRGRDAGFARADEAQRVGPVRHDENDFRRIILRLGRLDQRRHVRAAAGDQHGDALFHVSFMRLDSTGRDARESRRARRPTPQRLRRGERPSRRSRQSARRRRPRCRDRAPPPCRCRN